MKTLISIGVKLLVILNLAAIGSLCFAQSSSNPIDGQALFAKIHQLRIKLQPNNTEENGFLYMMNTPENLHLHLEFYQMLPNDREQTTLHIWALPADVKAHPELLGTPTDFPQMWVRYHGHDFIEAGASRVNYPANFGIDAIVYPNLIYHFAKKTVLLP